MISVVIAEDQAMVRDALAALLTMSGKVEVLAKVENGRLALAAVKELKPDVILSDIEMPEMTGLELIQALLNEQSKTKAIIVTTFARRGYLKRAMDLGVHGYLLKDSPSDSLITAIEKVVTGKRIIAPELVADGWTANDPLTEKERLALRYVRDGMKTSDIAKIMHLTHGTVRNYLSNASSKLNAANSIDAARIAHQSGWL